MSVRLLGAFAVLVLALQVPPPATAGSGADTSAAKVFLQRIYSQYSEHAQPHTSPDQAPGLYAPSLLRLMREDSRLARGEVGLLDYDVLCSCQDWNDLSRSRVQVTPRGRDRMTAKVALVDRANGNYDNLVLDLVRNGPRWQIADVHTRSCPSLKRYLESGLARIRRSER